MRRIALLAIWAAGLAHAECPQTFDPQNGMVLTSVDPPTHEVFRRGPNGLEQIRVVTIGDQKEETTFLYPHPLAVGRRTAGGVTLEITYDADLGQLDSLDRLNNLSSDLRLFRDGNEIAKGSVLWTFLGTGKVPVGDCSYRAWRIDEKMTLTGMDQLRFEKWYDPQLGLVLLAVQKSATGATLSSAGFNTIATGAAE